LKERLWHKDIENRVNYLNRFNSPNIDSS